MHYDQESNIISIELSQAPISHAMEFGNFIIHVSPAGKPVMIEILDGSKLIKKFNKIKNLKQMKVEEMITAG